MFRAISKFSSRLLGLTIITQLRCVAKEVRDHRHSHTSNWDFPIGMMVRSALGFDAKYVGKTLCSKPGCGRHPALAGRLSGRPKQEQQLCGRGRRYLQQQGGICHHDRSGGHP